MSPELTAALRAETPSAPAELRERVALIAATPPRLAGHSPPTDAPLGRACGGRRLLARRCRRRRSRHLVHPPPSASTPSAVQNLERKVAPSRAREGQRDSVTRLLPPSPGPQSQRPAGVEPRMSRPSSASSSTTPTTSAATQRALRTTRRLGGYVVTVNYGTPEPTEGTATCASASRCRASSPRSSSSAASAGSWRSRRGSPTSSSSSTSSPDRSAGRRTRSASRPFGASASSSTAAPRTRRSTWP